MRDSRLSHAISACVVTLPPDGVIGVFRPRADADLSALPRDRVQIIQGFRPDFDAWKARGYHCAVAPEGRFAAALVCIPRSRAEARALIARAVALTDGPVIVDGQKTDGIEGLLKECRKRAEVRDVISKAHGKLFLLSASPDAVADWAIAPTTGGNGFTTIPGVFSADAIDPGSALLAGALPARLKGRVADLGAGWGYLAAEVARRHPDVTEIHLIEAEHAALDCARANVTDPRARFHWADATTFTAEAPFDVIVSNPPFHNSRAADPALGQAFLHAAARLIGPAGDLWLVANRHLPYERTLATLFRNVEEVAGIPGFKVLHATRPLKPRRSR